MPNSIRNPAVYGGSIKKPLRLLLALAFSATLIKAQGMPINGTALSQTGQPIPEAQVLICVGYQNPITIPCSPKATLYANSTLTGTPIPNPTNANQFGNYQNFFVAAGSYTIQVSGAGYVTNTFYWSVSNGSAAVITVNGGSILPIVNLNNTTPTASPGFELLQFQVSGPNVSGAVPLQLGNGTTIVDVSTIPGVDPTGVSDSTAALNAAFQTAHAFVFPTGTYKVTAALVPQAQTAISCANPLSVDAGYTGPGTIIHAVHTGNAIIDMTGNAGLTMTNCVLEGDATTTPKTCIMVARNASQASAGSHVINNVSCAGSFSQAALYNVSSENNEWDNLKINILGGGAPYVIYGSAANDLGIGTTGQGSTEMNIFHNLSVSNYNKVGTTQSLIWLALYGPELRSWDFDGLNMSLSEGHYITMNNPPVSSIPTDAPGPFHFENVVGEINAGGSSGDALLFSSNPIHGVQIHGLNFTTNEITAGQYLICNTSTLDAANISLYAPLGNYLVDPACVGAFTNSRVDFGLGYTTDFKYSGSVVAPTQYLVFGNGTNEDIVLPSGDTFDIIGPTLAFSLGGLQGGPRCSAAITHFAITSGVVTFTNSGSNCWQAGDVFNVYGLATGTYLNNLSYTVLPTGLSSTNFEATTLQGNVGSTADTGLATQNTDGRRVTLKNTTAQVFTGNYRDTNSLVDNRINFLSLNTTVIGSTFGTVTLQWNEDIGQWTAIGGTPPTNLSTNGNAATATALASYASACSGNNWSQGLTAGPSNNCAKLASSNLSDYVADSTFTVSSSTTVGANSCDGGHTLSMSGVTTGMTFNVTATTDTHAVTGWGAPAAGVLYITDWPTSGTFNYYICNNTGSGITTGSSVSFNVSAK